MILALRTDKPEAELQLYNDQKLIDQLVWHAHRELSDTLLLKIEELLLTNSLSKSDLTAIVAYEGPGSFTGLRIGLSVANALSYSLNVPIAGTSGDSWQQDGMAKLSAASAPSVVMPLYGSDPHITKPRK